MIATESDVRSAYRLLLGREPDAQGFEHYVQWIGANGVIPQQLVEQFLHSPEFQARHPSLFADRGTVVPAGLVRVEVGDYAVFASERDNLIGASLTQGEYEPYVMGRFKRRLAPGDHVLDVGANIGIFTMAAASKVGSSGRVVAVEPLPANHRSLYAGIVHNGFENVSVMPFAASDRPGIISAICGRDSSNGIVGVHAQADSYEINVPMHRLDDVLATLPRLDVVKIDIEGHEPLAWDGMIGLLRHHRPDVFSEFSPIAMKNVGNDALAYLAKLLAYSDRVTVLHRDMDAIECRDAEAVMHEWCEANRRAGLSGEMHLDLFIEGRRESPV